ncbi:MAG: amidohydrolase family protein, partial [Alphaproteobacteria bacterium]|nr:amidohydrolase family protein [Alphaproteobacteria bacterium]
MTPDLLIRNATLIDGTGAPPRACSLAVAAGRVAAIIPPTQDTAAGLRAHSEIDAAGLVVAPGFIDIHSHSDYTLLVDPRALSSIAQGVTLEVIGNCGWGCQPIGDPALSREIIYGYDGSIDLGWRTTAAYFDRLQAAAPAVNVVALVPNGQLRMATVGTAERPADPAEVKEMAR